MNKRLHTRLATIMIAMAIGIIIISTVSIIWGTHYHISLYEDQLEGINSDLPKLDYHLEQALIQSILWTSLGSILISIFIGIYVAKRISAPLVEMKRVAEQMTNGLLDTRVTTRGDDELAELGTSFNKLAEQLQKQEQLRVTMTEDVAHELRTPLATLKSHMRALKDGIWDPTPERIHSCYEEIERLIQLVAELEDLTHMESPEFKLMRKQEWLDPVIEKGMNLVSAAFIEKEVSLKFITKSNARLYIDQDRIIQILVNLLTNALRFTPRQGEVRIDVNNLGDNVKIIIKDTGKGIQNEDLPYIFERFYRGEKSRNRRTGGSGLGLTIVKNLVKAHGGKVWAENELGAKFIIQLPNR